MRRPHSPRGPAPAPAAQQVDAGKTRPLLVRREQLRRLVELDPAAPERRAELHERRGRRRGRAGSCRAPRARSPRATTARGRARAAAAPRPPRSAACAAARGRSCGRRRTSAEARWVASPSRRSSAGERAPMPSRVGAGSPIARMMARSIASARRASISWPQIARSTACATVAQAQRPEPVQRRGSTGRAADRAGTGAANSVVSASSASMKRSSSRPALVGRLQQRRAVAPLPGPAGAAARQRRLVRSARGSSGAVGRARPV